MTIRYLTRRQIEVPRWDACVAASEQSLVYAYSWYLDAVAEHWGGIVAEEQGNYLAVMPVPYRRRWGLTYVCQPDFCQQLGIFSRPDVEAGSLFLPFWSVLQRRFRRVASYRFNEHNEGEFLFPPEVTRLERENHVLPLHGPYNTIWRYFSSDRKINLKRARNTGWEIVWEADMRVLIQLHRDHNEAKATRGYRQLDLRLYDRLVGAVKELQKRGMAELWLARLDGRTEAGCLFVKDHNRIIYLFNAASATGRRKQARLWMLNRIFEDYAGGSVEFDFESPVAGANSVKAYYHSFGSQTRRYSEIHWQRWEWRLFRRIKRLVTKKGTRLVAPE